jgi:hypothetical protein
LQRLTSELEQATFRLSEVLYQQETRSGDGSGDGHGGEAGYEQAQPQGQPQDETVIDTEFK